MFHLYTSVLIDKHVCTSCICSHGCSVHSGDGRNPALVYGRYPSIYMVLYIPGGARILPSTISSHRISFYINTYIYCFTSTCIVNIHIQLVIHTLVFLILIHI